MPLRPKTRPTIRGLLLATALLTISLGMFRLSVSLRLEELGILSLLISICVFGSVIGYIVGGQNGIINGYVIAFIITILVALALPSSPFVLPWPFRQ